MINYIRTTIQLPPKEYEKIRKQAFKERKSIAKFIREILEKYIK
ncbi:MAG: ribbon-helix-helix protein, CopG family [Gammaproteobacteria bacterium]|nr:ribbon-helix-helix protein, CopG family [Gammaproteobacteria bacterium]